MFTSATFTTAAKDVNLMPWCGPVLDQGNAGSCVANATVADMNLLENRMHQPYDYSTLGLYYDVRNIEGRLGQSGVSPIDNFNVLKTQGIGKGSVWPYELSPSGDVINENVAPPAAYYNNLTKCNYSQLASDPENWQVLSHNIDLALSEGRPVLVSFTADKWFWNMTGPLKDQQTNLIGHFDTTPVGGHEVLIVGRDSSVNGGSYIYQNSWGASYGDHGFGEMSVTWSADFTTAVVLDSVGNNDFTYTNNKQFVAQAYVAGLGRAVDAGGVNYWANELNTKTQVQVMDTIVSLTDNATKTNSQFVNDVYLNTLGRQADTNGFNYWVGKLNAGESKGGVLVDIINAVNGYTGTDTSGLYSYHLFENKSEQSAYYGIQLGANDTTIAQHALLNITDDPNSVQIGRTGISHELGWM